MTLLGNKKFKKKFVFHSQVGDLRKGHFRGKKTIIKSHLNFISFPDDCYKKACEKVSIQEIN